MKRGLNLQLLITFSLPDPVITFPDCGEPLSLYHCTGNFRCSLPHPCQPSAPQEGGWGVRNSPVTSTHCQILPRSVLHHRAGDSSALMETLAIGQLGLLPGLSNHFPFKVSKPSIFHKHLTHPPLFFKWKEIQGWACRVVTVSRRHAPGGIVSETEKDAQNTSDCQTTTGEQWDIPTAVTAWGESHLRSLTHTWAEVASASWLAQCDGTGQRTLAGDRRVRLLALLTAPKGQQCLFC